MESTIAWKGGCKQYPLVETTLPPPAKPLDASLLPKLSPHTKTHDSGLKEQKGPCVFIVWTETGQLQQVLPFGILPPVWALNLGEMVICLSPVIAFGNGLPCPLVRTAWLPWIKWKLN